MKTINIFKIAAFALIGLLVMACGSNNTYKNVDELLAQVSPNVTEITVTELHQLFDDGEIIVLIDVREANEFNPGYIPGAVNIPRGLIEFNVLKDDFWENQFLYPPLKTDLVVVYCKKGHRGLLTADVLQKFGFENVKYLKGGFKAWELAYPNEQLKNLEQVHDGGAEVGGC
ncbi:MAG: rhodanese-like domain-containing protein [Bacteroidales bacterium]|nr:rhodanese-like domain-containing protein [Bacteroidales bacterium]